MQSPSESEENEPSPATLIFRIQAGDRSAFRLLMESHQRYAYAVAFRLLHDAQNAKDVVQEAFIRVWKNLHAYRQDVRFTTWLYKIVVHLCYDRMKMESRRARWFGFRSVRPEEDEVAHGRGLAETIEDSDLCEHILYEAKKLPPKQRLVFQLRDIQDLSIEEIAGLAGMSTSSVKTNLCYARRRLRLVMMAAKGGEKP